MQVNRFLYDPHHVLSLPEVRKTVRGFHEDGTHCVNTGPRHLAGR